MANKIESRDEYNEVMNCFGQTAFRLYSIGFDRLVVEADKMGILLQDYVPDSLVLRYICKIKDCLLEV